MIKEEFSDLTGKVLVATPFTMEGNMFHKSLIYVARHGIGGAVGLIFNRLAKNNQSKELFQKLDSNIKISRADIDTHIGGPIDSDHGFFLHTNDYDVESQGYKSEDSRGLSVSSDPQILSDIMNDKGPKNTIFTLGYTGWEAGQIEDEIEKNLWIVTNPINDIIFMKDLEKKWSAYLKYLGIFEENFMPHLAHC